MRDSPRLDDVQERLVWRKAEPVGAEDVVSHVFTTTTHNWLLFFTSKGKVYRVKVHEVPETGRSARVMNPRPRKAGSTP